MSKLIDGMSFEDWITKHCQCFLSSDLISTLASVSQSIWSCSITLFFLCLMLTVWFISCFCCNGIFVNGVTVSWELAATSWHLQSTTVSPAIPKAFVAWVGTRWRQQSMERMLEVGLGGQCTPRGRPHHPTTGLCSSPTTMVSPEPFPHRTRSLRCL